MRRSRIVRFVVFFLAGAARADTESVPQLRVMPGIGIGFFDLSLELNVEGPRIVPLFQRSTSVYPAERAPVVMVGARLFL
jgi:hypothetical protein